MAHALQELSAKFAGKLAAFQAAFQGFEGVFTQLVSEHREAEVLLELLSGSSDPKERRALWAELSALLTAHERAELQHVYKAFEDYPRLHAIVDEHARTAHRLETLVSELNGLPASAENWQLTLERIQAAVRQHVEEEERDFFVEAQRVLGTKGSKALEGPYLTAKRALLKSLLRD